MAAAAVVIRLRMPSGAARRAVRVLCVDDDESCRRALGRSFPTEMEVKVVATVDDALRTSETWLPDIVITDLDLRDEAGRDGVWLLNEVGRPGFVLTGSRPSIEGVLVVHKPASSSTLVAGVATALGLEASASGPPRTSTVDSSST